MLEEVSSYLDTNVTGLTVGTNLFAVEMPPEPPTCVTVYEYDGAGEMDSFGNVGVYEDQRLQVQVRGPDYSTTRTLADLVHTALHVVAEATVGGHNYHRIRSTGTWMVLEIDSKSRIRLKRDYEIKRVLP